MRSIETITVDTLDYSDDVTIGEQFKVGENVATYLGEFELTYTEPTEDNESAFAFEYNGDTFTLGDFERTDDRTGPIRWFDGIMFGTYDSGWVVKMTDDNEGIHLFSF